MSAIGDLYTIKKLDNGYCREDSGKESGIQSIEKIKETIKRDWSPVISANIAALSHASTRRYSLEQSSDGVSFVKNKEHLLEKKTSGAVFGTVAADEEARDNDNATAEFFSALFVEQIENALSGILPGETIYFRVDAT